MDANIQFTLWSSSNVSVRVAVCWAAVIRASILPCQPALGYARTQSLPGAGICNAFNSDNGFDVSVMVLTLSFVH